jgi:hypothetical protein
LDDYLLLATHLTVSAGWNQAEGAVFHSDSHLWQALDTNTILAKSVLPLLTCLFRTDKYSIPPGTKAVLYYLSIVYLFLNTMRIPVSPSKGNIECYENPQHKTLIGVRGEQMQNNEQSSENV